jgi:DNA-binding response OmpR family regulator
MTDQLPLVLIVEDESDLADMYARWMEDKYRVRTAYSGDEAVEQLDNEIDLILVDRRMPGRCGAEVVEEVHEQGINCRVSMVTAMEREFGNTDIEFDAYLLKPVRRDTLIETTEDLLTATANEFPQQSRHPSHRHDNTVQN